MAPVEGETLIRALQEEGLCLLGEKKKNGGLERREGPIHPPRTPDTVFWRPKKNEGASIRAPEKKTSY